MSVKSPSTSRALGSVLVGLAAVAGCASDKAADETPEPYDIEIAADISGNGDPLLMIMGYGSTKDMWDTRVMQALSAKYRVIVFDNRGMGDTALGTQPFTVEQFAEDANHVLDELSIPRAHVLGWSLGGDIAMQLAVSHPERVKSLVLYASHCDGGKMFPPSQSVIDALEDTSGTPEERGQRLVGLLFPPEWLEQHGSELGAIFGNVHETSDPQNIAMQSQALQQWAGVCSALESLAIPTLVVSGDSDLIVPVENAQYVGSHIPGASSLIVPNAGHGLMYQEPETLSDAVLTFLNKGPANARAFGRSSLLAR